MKKFIYSALAALSIFAFASCDSLSDNEKDPNEEILAGYYKPLVGKWNVGKWYGTETDEYGVEQQFDHSILFEYGTTYTFEFDDNNSMTSIQENSDCKFEDTYEVTFKIDVPNFFRASVPGISYYLDYEIVKITDSTLHIIETSKSMTSHYECVRIR